MERFFTKELASKRLSEVLSALDMKQADFCRASGYTSTYVSAVLSGKKNIGIDMLYVLWNVLSVNAHWFFSGKGDMFIHANEPEIKKVAEKKLLYKTTREIVLETQLEECRRMNDILLNQRNTNNDIHLKKINN